MTGRKVVFLLGDQGGESGGEAISEKDQFFMFKSLKYEEINERHLWQTGVSARVRIHTKVTAMPAQCNTLNVWEVKSVLVTHDKKSRSEDEEVG